MNLKTRDDVKRYNVSEQFNETMVLQTKIREEPSLEPYIRTKSNVGEDTIKQIKKLRKETVK
jgi:hypothetical protein